MNKKNATATEDVVNPFVKTALAPQPKSRVPAVAVTSLDGLEVMPLNSFAKSMQELLAADGGLGRDPLLIFRGEVFVQHSTFSPYEPAGMALDWKKRD
jgi:hypothetical protein